MLRFRRAHLLQCLRKRVRPTDHILLCNMRKQCLARSYLQCLRTHGLDLTLDNKMQLRLDRIAARPPFIRFPYRCHVAR